MSLPTSSAFFIYIMSMLLLIYTVFNPLTTILHLEFMVCGCFLIPCCTIQTGEHTTNTMTNVSQKELYLHLNSTVGENSVMMCSCTENKTCQKLLRCCQRNFTHYIQMNKWDIESKDRDTNTKQVIIRVAIKYKNKEKSSLCLINLVDKDTTLEYDTLLNG